MIRATVFHAPTILPIRGSYFTPLPTLHRRQIGFPFLLKPIERTAGEIQNRRRFRVESDRGWLKSRKLGHRKGEDS